MRDFFRGWRRKIGVLTLLMACVFAAGWVRSVTTCDFVGDFSSDLQVLHEFSSTRMGLMYMRTDMDFTGETRGITFVTRPWKFASGTDCLSGAKMHWRIDSCGFRFGENHYRHPQAITGITAYIIPYWSIVIPLTLLSAYLLLSKPRVAKPPESTKPPDEAQVTHA